MMNKKIMAVAVSAAVMLMTGCGSDSKKNPPPPAVVASSSSVAVSSSSVAVSSSVASSSSQAAVVLPSAVTCVGTVCTVKGVVDKSFTMTADKTWLLEGTVLVGKGNVELTSQSAIDAVKAAGVTLTVEPGVEVKAKEGSTLIITRGNKIHAVGTKEKPIGFSSVDANYDGYSEWKGLVIQGFAPYYLAGDLGICSKDGAWCNKDGEGGTEVGKFGGTDKADNSGMLKYVRIAETGFVARQGSEINGLTLMGVGHGTTLDYIQLHNSGDDAVEWFGGTVNLTHAVLTNTDDDDIDFDLGYQGNIQHVLVRKDPAKLKPTGSNDPRGIEANSDKSKTEQVSDTRATLANITIVGSDLVNVKLEVKNKDTGVITFANQQGMRLRGEVKTHIWNSAVSDFETCIQIDDGMNNFHNFMGACTGTFLNDKSAGNSYMADVVTQKQNATELTFNSNWALTETGAKLGAPVAAIAAVDNGSGFSFNLTDYIGAVDPDATEAWWAGWTIPGSLDK